MLFTNCIYKINSFLFKVDIDYQWPEQKVRFPLHFKLSKEAQKIGERSYGGMLREATGLQGEHLQGIRESTPNCT